VCAYALARIDPDDKQAREKAVKMLTAAIAHENPRAQSAALRGLMELDAKPEQIAPELCACIGDCDPALLNEMLSVLAASGEAGVPALVVALGRPDARGLAAHVLGRLGPKAKAAVPALAKALADEQAPADVRREVILALAAIGPDALEAAGALEANLSDDDPLLRAPAAYALGRIGPAAKAALPKLQGGLTSPEPIDRVASAYALVHVAPGDEALQEAAVPVLIHGLKNPLAPARRGAAEALGHVGQSVRRAAEGPLREAARDTDETVRAAALEALEKIGAAPPRQR
jgi:HEAT repeat protein